MTYAIMLLTIIHLIAVSANLNSSIGQNGTKNREYIRDFGRPREVVQRTHIQHPGFCGRGFSWIMGFVMAATA